MSGKTLHLSFDTPVEGVPVREQFVITEDIEPNGRDWFVEFSDIDIDQDSAFSYDTFWPHIVHPARGNLLIYTMLYQELRNQILHEETTRLVTHDLAPGYRCVAEDLAETYDITVDHQGRVQNRDTIIGRVLLSFSVILLFLDELVAIARNHITSPVRPLENQHLFFPFPDRYESMLPVIRQLSQPLQIIVSPLTIRWRYLNAAPEWVNEFRTTTLTEFATLSLMGLQVLEFVDLQRAIITDNTELADALQSHLSIEYGINLQSTINYVCRSILRRDIRMVLSQILIESTIESTNPRSVVVGGMSPREIHTLNIAADLEVQRHYIPHSIVNDTEIIPPDPQTNHYVSGRADMRMLQEKYPKHRLSKVYTTGRPYLDNIIESTACCSATSTNPTIIIGTQPYEDWIREKFIADVLEAIDASGFDGDVVVKIHPSESVEFYQSLDIIAESTNVTIETGNIEGYVNESTTLIVIDSNVGIEGALLGAFCISYNPFEPFISAPSYVDGIHVPWATSVSALQKILSDVAQEGDHDQKDQYEYIRESFISGGSAKKIASVIEGEGTI